MGRLTKTLGVMKPTAEQHNDFFAHKPLPGVCFGHNVGVQVQSGPHAGSGGSIISVEELGDDPLYLVELGSGKDIRARQSQLRAVDA